MIKEQAIELIKEYKVAKVEFPNDLQEQALDMAIKALEQPTSDDCISRKAVDLLCFKYLKPNTDDNIAFYEHFCDLPPVTLAIPTSDDCVSRQALINSYNVIETPVGYRKVVDMQVVEDLPPVTPTRKAGKWIEEPNCYLRCSCCNSHYPHISIYVVKGSNYCPNCGAEMVGVENG